MAKHKLIVLYLLLQKARVYAPSSIITQTIQLCEFMPKMDQLTGNFDSPNKIANSNMKTFNSFSFKYGVLDLSPH